MNVLVNLSPFPETYRVPTDCCHSSTVDTSRAEKVKYVGFNSRGLENITFEVTTCQIHRTSIHPCKRLFHLPLDLSRAKLG